MHLVEKLKWEIRMETTKDSLGFDFIFWTTEQSRHILHCISFSIYMESKPHFLIYNILKARQKLSLKIKYIATNQKRILCISFMFMKKNHSIVLKSLKEGTGGMSKLLGVLAVFPKDLGPIISTYPWLATVCNSSSRRLDTHTWPVTPNTHLVHRHECNQTLIHI